MEELSASKVRPSILSFLQSSPPDHIIPHNGSPRIREELGKRHTNHIQHIANLETEWQLKIFGEYGGKQCDLVGKSLSDYSPFIQQRDLKNYALEYFVRLPQSTQVGGVTDE